MGEGCFFMFSAQLASESSGRGPAVRAPGGGWNVLIDEVSRGKWVNPTTGNYSASSETECIEIAESLEGREAELVQTLKPEGPLAVVADENTWEAMGKRVFEALTTAGMKPRDVIISGHPHADLQTVADLTAKLQGIGHAVAVGSGTVNDLAKYVAFQTGSSSSVFGTACSMDGYVSTTVSMTLESGLKVSIPAQGAKGAFFDLQVIANAPRHLNASGFGDCLCKSVAKVDWWMSHRLLGSFFTEDPYLIAEENDREMFKRAAGIGTGNMEDIGYLLRSLILSGLGVGFTRMSNHGSMGEHQISHYIDCFAGDRHKGTLHGQQVGVASLTMARIQQDLLKKDRPPRLEPTRIDEADVIRRMGAASAKQCLAEYRKKALDVDGAKHLNDKLEELWPSLRMECLEFVVPIEEMQAQLKKTGGPCTGEDLGLPRAFYQEAVSHAHEMRNRFSFTDLACDAGLLDGYAADEQ